MAADPWRTVTALVDPLRRALYEYVRGQDHPVTREQAAEAKGISRGLAAFHLDKLVDVGLLRARYRSAPDRPRGRGRSPKIYEPAGGGMTLTIPERRYRLFAEILADAVAEHPADAQASAWRRASAHGLDLGAQLGRDIHGADDITRVRCALAELGFEPRLEAKGRLTLRNCPFHEVARVHPELVCGLNHAFVAGLLTGLEIRTLTAHPGPRPGACCVELRRLAA